MDEIFENTSNIVREDPIERRGIEKVRHGILGFFIEKIRLTLLLVISIIFLGIGALLTIPRESEPEVEIPLAIVTTVYLGASPADVEQLVTNEIEEKIEELDSLKEVTSNSSLGISSIIVEFEAEADLKESIDALKEKIDEVRNLPDEAETPIVTEARINDAPIIVFSLAGNLDERRLKTLAEIIQDELESINGVSEAPISGDRRREFQVIVDRSKIGRLNISLSQIVASLASHNIDSPLGSIVVDGIDYNIRTISKLRTLDDISSLPVASVNRSAIQLSDVATIKDDFSELETISRISLGGKAPLQTMSISLFKKTGGNILNIVDSAKERIQELKAKKIIPENVEVEVSSDFSTFIRRDLNTLGSSGIQSVILIFITFFVALSYREAIVSLLAIPMTFLITLFFLNIFGFSLNSMSLFTLVLSLGLLVDGFIIILEGIFDSMRKGYASKDASFLSIYLYFTPLVSSMLTTIAAFVPMLLVSGIVGEYLEVMPITMSISLTASLFVSLAIVPALSSVLLRSAHIAHAKRKESLLERFVTKRLREKYKNHIAIFLSSKKKKIRLGLSLGVMFVISMILLIVGIIPVELFPKVDINFGFIDLEMPIGTELSITDAAAREVDAYLLTVPEIKTFVTSIGQGSSFGFIGGGGGSGSHLANFNITFVDLEDRDEKSFEINERMRKDLEKIVKTGIVNVREISAGPPTGAPIEVRITGDNLTVLGEMSSFLVSELKKIEGVIEVESDQDVSPADFTFRLKSEELQKSALTIPEVTAFLRTAIFGVTATEINVSGEDVDVVVRMPNESVDSVEEIQNMSVPNRLGQSVKLSRVADFSLEPALSSIRHRDFEKTLSVRANLIAGYKSAPVIASLEQKVLEKKVPEGYDFHFGGEVEDIEQSFQELWNAMVIAVILIVTILVLQFNSFRKPLIIMFELPLVLIGVVIGMLLFRLPFSFSVFLGIISLAGISVNDAIVLIDRTKQNIEKYGLTPRKALIEAGESRLQAILLTSITTIMGVLPLAFADEFWLGLSIAIAFGLAFATILQLYVVPMLFLKLEGNYYLRMRGFIIPKKQNIFSKFFTKILVKRKGSEVEK